MVFKFFCVAMILMTSYIANATTAILNEPENLEPENFSHGSSQSDMRTQPQEDADININQTSENFLKGSRYNLPKPAFHQHRPMLTQPQPTNMYDEDSDPTEGEGEEEENSVTEIDFPEFLDTANILSQLSTAGFAATGAT